MVTTKNQITQVFGNIKFFYKYTTSENSSDSDCEMEVENTSLHHTVEYVLGIDFDFCLPTHIIYIV